MNAGSGGRASHPHNSRRKSVFLMYSFLLFITFLDNLPRVYCCRAARSRCTRLHCNTELNSFASQGSKCLKRIALGSECMCVCLWGVPCIEQLEEISVCVCLMLREREGGEREHHWVIENKIETEVLSMYPSQCYLSVLRWGNRYATWCRNTTVGAQQSLATPQKLFIDIWRSDKPEQISDLDPSHDSCEVRNESWWWLDGDPQVSLLGSLTF